MWLFAADDSWVVAFEGIPIEVNVTEMKIHENVDILMKIFTSEYFVCLILEMHSYKLTTDFSIDSRSAQPLP